MDCVFHMYMQWEDKAMVMTLYMTVVKQHSQHIMTPTITIYMIVVKQLTNLEQISLLLKHTNKSFLSKFRTKRYGTP
jgi:hypothetical protein